MCCMLLCFMQLANGHVMVVGGYSIVLILAGYEDSMFNHMHTKVWSSLERSWGPGSSPVLNLIKLLIHSYVNCEP